MADTPAKTDEAETPSDTVKVRLLARGWQKPVFGKDGEKVVSYRRVNRGEVLTVSRDEFEQLNVFKPTFEEVDE